MSITLLQKAEKIVAQSTGEEGYCALGLIDLDGYPTISTITVSKSDGLRWLTFDTGLNSNKVKRIRHCNRASVCFQSAAYTITLVGTIEVRTDPQVKKEMWYKGMEDHFSGPEDPDYCVLRFTTERYHFLVDWQEGSGAFPPA